MDSTKRHNQYVPTWAILLLGLTLLWLVPSCSLPDVRYSVLYQAGVVDAKGRPVPAKKDLAMTGGTVGTKSKSDKRELKMGNDYIKREIVGNDETAIPRYAIQSQTAIGLGEISGNVTKNAANNETQRVLSNDDVRKTAITAPLAADVEKAKIAAEAPQ